MVWAPTFKSVSRNHLRDNIIAYWNLKQVEALAWARSELGLPATPVTPPTTNFYTSTVGRVFTTFPHANVVSATTASGKANLGDDTYESRIHTFVFEFEIAGTNANQITDDADIYATAFESVLTNIPSATLLAGMTDVAGGNLEVTSVDPDELRGQPTDGETGQWYKAPQITVTIELIEG